jgi:hypothetical protein
MTPATELFFDPILPAPLLALLAAALLFLTVRIYWSVGRSIGRGRNLALLFFRVAGLALVLALLLQPSRREFLPPPTRDRVTLIGLDSSLSMKQRDAGERTRFDAARNLLLESGAVGQNGVPGDLAVAAWQRNLASAPAGPLVRLFEFSDDARPVQRSVLDLAPAGKTTRFHKSVGTMLGAAANDEAVNAVVLLTDGHDFELVNPVKTGALARQRQAPIYAVALGKQGKVRDVAVRITGFQPYCYVKQKARINATLRLIGCELEDLTVQLLREGQVVQTKHVNAQQLQELPVEFEVTEPETGQYEYEVRVPPLEDEVDTANNSAITYLNVIDQQIRVLLAEGDPYWDTTFLQRSLMRNDKFDVDALIRYGTNRVRAIRKTPGTGELRAPQTLDQFAAYDVIILGRSVDSLFDTPPANGAEASGRLALLDQYVNERGGTVIFSRGRAFTNAGASELEPVVWGGKSRARVHLDVTAEGRALSPFRVLNDGEGGLDALPDLLDGKTPQETKPLASTFAVATGKEDPTPEAAIIHRRYGRGQVVSLGVAGLWRWALASKAEGVNSPFDRFWDQMVLWLLAGRDFIPNKQFSFRPNSANILLGEKVYFRLVSRQPDPKLMSVPVTIHFGETEAGRVNLTPVPAGMGRLGAEFLPERAGRYRATVTLPDGTTQESRFIVFTENLEETEVATDTLYLRRLCESSGGRLIEPGEFPRLLTELGSQKADQTPKTLVRPVWNVAWVFYLAGLLLGMDWFLRRRWGLC